MSDLVVGVLGVGAVSPLGQDDGLHVSPVQAAALLRVSGQLRRRVVVLEGGDGEDKHGFEWRFLAITECLSPILPELNRLRQLNFLRGSQKYEERRQNDGYRNTSEREVKV